MSSAIHSSDRCMICEQMGHKESKCPSLDMPPFTFGSGTGGGVHQPDDEDEEKMNRMCVKVQRHVNHVYSIILKNRELYSRESNLRRAKGSVRRVKHL